jgi:hypothetical protein
MVYGEILRITLRMKLTFLEMESIYFLMLTTQQEEFMFFSLRNRLNASGTTSMMFSKRTFKMTETIFYVDEDKFKMKVVPSGSEYECTFYVYGSTTGENQTVCFDWFELISFPAKVPTLSLNKQIFLDSLLLSE